MCLRARARVLCVGVCGCACVRLCAAAAAAVASSRCSVAAAAAAAAAEQRHNNTSNMSSRSSSIRICAAAAAAGAAGSDTWLPVLAETGDGGGLRARVLRDPTPCGQLQRQSNPHAKPALRWSRNLAKSRTGDFAAKADAEIKVGMMEATIAENSNARLKQERSEFTVEYALNWSRSLNRICPDDSTAKSDAKRKAWMT